MSTFTEVKYGASRINLVASYVHKMTCGRCLLSLKANGELFNFIQQASLLLMFSSSVISYFAFKPFDAENNKEAQDVAYKLKVVAFVMWAVTSIISAIVLLTYLQEYGFQRSKNAWGETIYEFKNSKKVKKEKEKNNQLRNRPIFSDVNNKRANSVQEQIIQIN